MRKIFFIFVVLLAVSCGNNDKPEIIAQNETDQSNQTEKQNQNESSTTSIADDTQYIPVSSQNNTPPIYRGIVTRNPDFFKKEERNLFEDTWIHADIKEIDEIYKLSKDKNKEDQLRNLILKLRNTSCNEKEQECEEIKQQIKDLINSGASVNTHYRNWRSTGTLVHAFISLEDLGMLKYVLENGARVDIAEYLGMTPLLFLFDRGLGRKPEAMEYFRLLLEHNCDVNAASGHNWGDTVLMEAARNHNMELINLFLDYGADINEVSGGFSQTALCYTYFNNEKNSETGAYLIAQGADYTEERAADYYIKGDHYAPMIGSAAYSFTIPKELVKKYREFKREEAVIRSYFYSNFLVYDEDFYMYHPVKIFDDDPATGWLDGEDSAGEGCSIGIVLDRAVTVDEIRVAPGYFDKRWYNDNNRVKQLSVRIGEETIDHTFKDEFAVQSIPLKKEYSFYEIEFIIKDVYPSAASNDTAISEIRFFHSGKKIKLHLSKSKKYFKKTTLTEKIEEIRYETNLKYNGSSTAPNITIKNKLTPELYKHFLGYCGIPEESIAWSDMNDNGIAEISELTTLNADHLKRLWNYSTNISDGGFSSDDYHKEIINRILDGSVANVYYLLKSDIDVYFTYKGSNFITFACTANNINLLNYFYNKGVDANKPDENFGWTPLFYAVNNDNNDAVKWLVEKRVKVNQTDKFDRTPLMQAVQKNNVPLIYYLIENGANINVKDNGNQNLLFHAAMVNNQELVQYFDNNNISIHELNYSGNNAAMATKNEKIILYLLEKGAEYTVRNKEGKALLEIAAENGFNKVVEILLTKEDVLINGQSEDQSPLILAAKNNRTEIVNLLLVNGADVNVHDDRGNNALFFAIQYINLEMAIILKRFGICMDCKINGKISPLQILQDKIDAYNNYISMYDEADLYGEYDYGYGDFDIGTAEAFSNLLEGYLYY